MAAKYKITTRKRGDVYHIVVTNRAGRAWESKTAEGDYGNAAESAMVTDEYVNGGGKLHPDSWRLYATPEAPAYTVRNMKPSSLAELI